MVRRTHRRKDYHPRAPWVQSIFHHHAVCHVSHSYKHLRKSTPTKRGDLKQGLTSRDQIGVGNCNITHIWRLGGDQCWSPHCCFRSGVGHGTGGWRQRSRAALVGTLTHGLAIRGGGNNTVTRCARFREAAHWQIWRCE